VHRVPAFADRIMASSAAVAKLSTVFDISNDAADVSGLADR